MYVPAPFPDPTPLPPPTSFSVSYMMQLPRALLSYQCRWEEWKTCMWCSSTVWLRWYYAEKWEGSGSLGTRLGTYTYKLFIQCSWPNLVGGGGWPTEWLRWDNMLHMNDWRRIEGILGLWRTVVSLSQKSSCHELWMLLMISPGYFSFIYPIDRSPWQLKAHQWWQHALVDQLAHLSLSILAIAIISLPLSRMHTIGIDSMEWADY